MSSDFVQGHTELLNMYFLHLFLYIYFRLFIYFCNQSSHQQSFFLLVLLITIPLSPLYASIQTFREPDSHTSTREETTTKLVVCLPLLAEFATKAARIFTSPQVFQLQRPL